ncbi:MAG: hypothetical protein HC788_01005 [Sphingopyxis sp.]|nr:hypothetical protein [Sphingopyxis sp.]
MAKSSAIALAGLSLIAMPSPTMGCVIIQPLIEDVHAVIQYYSVRTLRKWIAWNKETLDVRSSINGRTPLMAALFEEKPKQFKVLLEAGANPDLTDNVGNTALHIAAQINEPGHVLTLLKAGANPNVLNAQNETFQKYLFMTDDKLLTAQSRLEMSAVKEWLRSQGIAVRGD